MVSFNIKKNKLSGSRRTNRLTRLTAAIQAKQKTVADPVACRWERERVSVVSWSPSDVTCMVVCHCCSCFGGCCSSCCRLVIPPLIVSRGPKKSSLVCVVDVTSDWFTTSPFQSNCMCVLMTMLLFYSTNTCLYFQIVFHFVFGELHRITHWSHTWQRWNCICLSTGFCLLSSCLSVDFWEVREYT